MTVSSGSSAELPHDFRNRLRALLVSRNTRAAAAALIFALCWLSLIWLPASPVTSDLDSSWSGALVHFSARGLQFGREVIFTFGPLGYLTSHAYTGELFTVRILWTVLSSAVFAAILTLAVFRLPLLWRAPWLLFLLLFSWRPDSVHVLVFAALAAELFRSGAERPAWNVLAAVVLGVCSLIKFSYFILALLIVVLAIASYAMRKRTTSAAALVLGYGGTLLLTWKIAGQDLVNLWPYLRYSKEIATGYKEAMALSDASNVVVLLGLTAALLTCCLGALGFFAAPSRHRLWAPLTLVGLTFLAWNHGFVRADNHVLEFFAVCPVALAVIWNAMDACPRIHRIGSAVIVVVFIACLAGMWVQMPESVRDSVVSARDRMKGGWAVLTSPRKITRSLQKTLTRQKRKEALPRVRAEVGNATVDVFGYEQGVAILNDLNYTPRPVFQSYTAYTPALIDVNAAFYSSEKAPAYVLFKLQPIDNHVPTLDDSGTLTQILLAYTFLFEERGYLLWKRKTRPPQPIALAELSRGEIRLGKRVPVPDAPLVWVETDLRDTLLGALRRVLYKPAEVRMTLKDSTGLATTYRMLSLSGRRGFLISPRVRGETRDAVEMATPEQLPRVVSFVIEAREADRRFLRRGIKVRFSSAAPVPP
jgi:hypothetical protein